MKTIHEIYSWFCCGDSWTHLGYDKLRQRWKHCYLRCVCGRRSCPQANQTDTNRLQELSPVEVHLELAQPEPLSWSPNVPQAKVFNGVSRMYFPHSERWKEKFLSVKKALFSKWFDFRLTDDEEKRTWEDTEAFYWKYNPTQECFLRGQLIRLNPI